MRRKRRTGKTDVKVRVISEDPVCDPAAGMPVGFVEYRLRVTAGPGSGNVYTALALFEPVTGAMANVDVAIIDGPRELALTANRAIHAHLVERGFLKEGWRYAHLGPSRDYL